MEPLADGDPRQIGPYRLLYRLGQGGMGRVYLGRSRGNRVVAIKVIHPYLAVDPFFVASFLREVDAAKAVSGAYTAPVIASSGLDDAQPWLATAYVEGPSLADAIIERQAPLPEVAVWRLASGLVEALQAVHACDLVHRDLKPANVLLALDGPRVIDFGISRALQDIVTTIGRQEPVGTPAYMSPEQAECKIVGPASDVFSLGSVIAFAATAKVLFAAPLPVIEMYRVINDQPDLTSIGQPLRGMLAACLAKNPADRPSLDELLDTIVAGGTAFSTASPSSFWPRELATYIRTRNDVTDPRRSVGDGPQILPARPVPAPVVARGPDAPEAEQTPPSDNPVGLAIDEPTAPPATSRSGLAEVTDGQIKVPATGDPAVVEGTPPDIESAETLPTAESVSMDPGEPTTPPEVGDLATLDTQTSVQAAPNGAVPSGDRPVLAGVSAIVEPAPGQVEPGKEVSGRRPWRPRPRWVYVATSAVVTFALAGALAWRLAPAAPSAAATSASYAPRVRHYQDGLVISARWTLGGRDGSRLTEQVTATEAAGAALSVQFETPLPMAVSRSLGAAKFSPSVPFVIDHGQGLVWSLHIPAHGDDVVYCEVDVSPGAVSKARLRMLVTTLSRVAEGPVTMARPKVTLQSLTIIPNVLRIAPGGSRRLTLMGLLSNGKRASGIYLSKVIWKTANAKVAKVNAVGKVTAVAVGRTRITVTKGTFTSSISVIVTTHPTASQSTGPANQQNTSAGSGSHSSYHSTPPGTHSSSKHSTPPPSSTPTITPTILP